MPKKLLSLIVCIIMTVSCLPSAFASDVITVGKNTPALLNYDNAKEIGEGVASDKLTSGQYLIFDVNILYAGNVKLTIVGLNSENAGYKIEIDGEAVTATGSAIKDNRYADYGTVELTEGLHTVKLEVLSGTLTRNESWHRHGAMYGIEMMYVRYHLPEAKGEKLTFEAENYALTNTAYYHNATQYLYNSVGTYTNAGSVYIAQNNWFTYDISVTKDSYYDVIAYTSNDDSKEGGSVPLSLVVDEDYRMTKNVSKSSQTREALCIEFKNVPLTSGDHTIKILNTADASEGVRIYYFEIVKGDEPMTLDSVSSGRSDILAGDAVGKGSDTIRMQFSMTPSAESINSDTVMLKQGDRIMKAHYKSVLTILYIYTGEAFKANEEYTIVLNGVTDANGGFPFYDEFTFATDDTDSGTSYVTVTKTDYEGKNILISGIIQSSGKFGISGRKVYLYSAEDKTTILAETVSGEDGEYTLTYTVPDDGETGEYKFTVDGEYARKTADASVYYVSSQTEDKILTELSNTTSSLEAENIFNTYEEILNTDSVIDASGLDMKKVYADFAGAEFSDLKELLAYWRKIVAREKINQAATTAEIEAVISDSILAADLGFDTETYAYIVNNKDNVLNEILALGELTLDELKAETDSILTKNLAKEYGKSDADLTADGDSVYANQVAYIGLSFKDSQTDVCKIVFEISVENRELLSKLSFKADDYDITKEVSEDKVVFILTAKNQISKEEIGKLSVTAPQTAGTYNLTINGKVYYQVPDVSKDIVVSIVECMTEITVKEQLSDRVSQTTTVSKGSSGGGSGSAVVIPPVDTPDTPQEEAYKFNDLENVPWAENEIYALLEKGIVSKSEDNKFNPNKNITREEFAKLLCEGIGLETESSDSNYKDVSSDAWYYDYVSAMSGEGYIKGDENGYFGTGTPITRQDMAVIIYRVLQKLSFKAQETESVYADDADISEYAKEAVYTLTALEFMKGMGENTFAPKGMVTRAQAAKVVYMLVEVFDR